MITLLAALLIQQTPPTIPPVAAPAASLDVPASVTRLVDHCRRAVDHRRLRTAQGFRVSTARAMVAYDRTVDETVTRLWTDPSGCQIVAADWTPEGDRMAVTVRQALTEWSPAFSTARWREPFANESGPSVWTTFEQKDLEGRTTGIVRLIEPADGAAGEASITYERPAP